MKALEVTGKIHKGQLILDYPLEIDSFHTVRVIILIPEAGDIDFDDTPIQEIKESLTLKGEIPC
jgi:acyl carrier protein